MRYFRIVIYLILFNTAKSQNLVPNPSFEIYSACPTTGNQLNYSTGWINPTSYGTPDYFNSCSSIISVPYCDPFGTCFQFAHTGNAYAGIYLYSKSTGNLREYIQTQLLNPLIPGQCYFTKFYSNQINWVQYSCNNIAMNFSVSQPTLAGSSSLLNLAPNILRFKNKIIADTLNWNTIQGIYVAGGGERYITIGNFNNDLLTDTLKSNSNGITDAAYYFIDDVSVIPIDSIIGGMPANAGADKSIAIGDSTFIGQEISNLNCNWYQLPSNIQIATNTSGIYVKPLSLTTYVVEQNLCGTITYDTVIVTVSPTMLKEYNTFSNSINVFPNPTTNDFTISYLPKSSKLKVDITDTQGKLYSTELIIITNNKATIKTNLTNGVYFVSITDTVSGLKVVKKLVVQK